MKCEDAGQTCYAVIFISQLRQGAEGYSELAEEMVVRVHEQPGFLGFDAARSADGSGITVSYWESLEAIEGWRNEEHHLQAQRLGREQFYEYFTLHVARVERSRRFTAS